MDDRMSKILIAAGILSALFVGLIIVVTFMFAGWTTSLVHAQEAPATVSSTVPQAPANDPITITKIKTTPVVYKDIDITLRGKIVGWVTKNSFIVSETGEKNSGAQLLVINDKRFGLPDVVPASDVALGENVNVIFSGTIRILKITDKDRSLGDEDETRELTRWNNTPVIFTNSVVQQ